MGQSIMLQLASSTFQVLGNINLYKNFTYHRRFYDMDECWLVIPTTIDTDFVKNNIIFYTFQDTVYPMIIRGLRKSTDTKDTTVYAVPYGGIDRRIIADPLDKVLGYGEINNNVSTIMETMITNECIAPLNGGRTIPYLAVYPTVLGGATIYQLQFQSLRQTLNELSMFGDVGYKVYWNETSCVFMCYQGSVKPYKFSEDYNNLKNAEYIDDYEPSCTYTLASTNTSRYVMSDDTKSGNDRYEELGQSGSTTTTVNEFDNILAEKKRQQSRITAEIIEAQYRYGVDFNVGDTVIIEAYGKTFTNRITEVVESYSQREGTSYEIKVGYPLPLLDDKVLDKFKYLDNYIYRVYKMAGGV